MNVIENRLRKPKNLTQNTSDQKLSRPQSCARCLHRSKKISYYEGKNRLANFLPGFKQNVQVWIWGSEVSKSFPATQCHWKDRQMGQNHDYTSKNHRSEHFSHRGRFVIGRCYGAFTSNKAVSHWLLFLSSLMRYTTDFAPQSQFTRHWYHENNFILQCAPCEHALN